MSDVSTSNEANPRAEESQFDRLLAAGVGPGRRASYGSRSDQFLEWFGEPRTARTVIALIHGGYFREQFTLDYMRPMAQALVDTGGGNSGVAVALVEYRRVGGEGGHPHTIEDIEAAVVLVSEVVSEGEHGLGGVRLVVTGHSAGGSLSLSWATRQAGDGPNVSVRPLAAVSDHVAEVRDNLADGAVLAYMGATPEEDPARYLAEDPRSRVALIPSRIDVRLIHGVADQTVNIAFARGFPAPRLEIAGANHFDVVDPQSPYFEEIARCLLG